MSTTEKEREYNREHNRRRRLDPEYRARQAAWAKAWREKNNKTPRVRAYTAAKHREYAADPRLRPRHEARWRLQRAVLAGRIKRLPCEVCGNPRSEAHHPDYAQPFTVRWLCREHHREQHQKAGGK